MLWDLKLGVPVVRWSGHTDSVGAIACSRKPGAWMLSGSTGANMPFVISGAADRTLQCWEVPSRALASLEQEAERARDVAAAEPIGVDSGKSREDNMESVATAGASWNPPVPLVQTARHSVRAHEKDINYVTISPNDAIVASASQDRTIRLWRATNLEPLAVLKGHKRGVWKVGHEEYHPYIYFCEYRRGSWSLGGVH